MIDFKKLFISIFVFIGIYSILLLVQYPDPSWLYRSLLVLFAIGALGYGARRPKPKLRYWLISFEYMVDKGFTQTKVSIRTSYDKPFLGKEDIDFIGRLKSFCVMEVDEQTARMIDQKMEEIKQSKAKDNDGLE